MTNNEIKKALECCVSEQYTCEQCPYQEIKHYDYDKGFELMPNGKQYDDWSCERWLMVDLLDLINRLQAEKEELQKFKSFFDFFYGCDLEILGVDEDGAAKPYDEFYDSAIADVENAELHIAHTIKTAKAKSQK